jgi:AcrR family transcriptional regulator
MSRSFFLHGDEDAPSKAAILQCALGLFVKNGLRETSIRDIAEASGYTNPALYKFFDGKDALSLHVFERCYEYVVGELDGSQDAASPYAANLEALLATVTRLMDEELAAVLYVNENLRLFWRRLPASARRRSILGLFRKLLEEGKREGVIPGDLDATIALAILSGTFGQLARMAYFGELPRPFSQHSSPLRAIFERAFGFEHEVKRP